MSARIIAARTAGEISIGTEKGNTAEASAVVSSVDAFATFVSEVKTKTLENRDALVRLKPFREGSFVVSFEILLLDENNGGLLPSHYEDLLNNLITLLQSYFLVKMHLGGDRPNSITIDGNVASIKNDKDDAIKVPTNLLSILDRHKTKTDDKFNTVFSLLERDSNIKSFSIKFNDNSHPITIGKQHFNEFSTAEPIIDTSEKIVRSKTLREKLKVVSVSFRSDLTWSFLRPNGSTIRAKILDENFAERLKARVISFTDGDELDVMMTFNEEYDSMSKVWIPARGKYTITEIYGHYPIDKPSTLF